MDEKLELRLIEQGYNPSEATEVTLEKAGEIMRDNFYGLPRVKELEGTLLFEGPSHVVVRTGLGNTILAQDYLGVSSGDGSKNSLYLSSSLSKCGRPSIYLEKPTESTSMIIERNSELRSTNFLDLQIWDGTPKNEVLAKLEFAAPKDTKIFYLPLTDSVQKDKLFWNHVASRLDLKLNPTKEEYTDKEPVTDWYSTRASGSSTLLTLGTRYRVHAVRADFPKKKSGKNLVPLVEGLNNVHPQTLGKSWVGHDLAGGKRDFIFESHIDKGAGEQVVQYLERVLSI